MTVSTEPTDAGALEALMLFYADAGVDISAGNAFVRQAANFERLVLGCMEAKFCK